MSSVTNLILIMDSGALSKWELDSRPKTRAFIKKYELEDIGRFAGGGKYVQREILASALNRSDIDDIISDFKQLEPQESQEMLFMIEGEDSYTFDIHRIESELGP